MTSKKTDASERRIIKELRALVPHRQLTPGESYALAEKQAAIALKLAGQNQPDVNLGWILELPKVEVQLAPRYKMDGLSGFTTFTHGRYLIMVNKTTPTPGAASPWHTNSNTSWTTPALRSSTGLLATATRPGRRSRSRTCATTSPPAC